MAKNEDLSDLGCAQSSKRRSSLPAFVFRTRKASDAKPQSLFKSVMDKSVSKAGSGRPANEHPPREGPPGRGFSRPLFTRRVSFQDSDSIPEDRPLDTSQTSSENIQNSTRRSSRCSRSSMEGSIPEETGSEEDDSASYQAELGRRDRKRSRFGKYVNRMYSAPHGVHGEDDIIGDDASLSRSYGGRRRGYANSESEYDDGGYRQSFRGPGRRTSFMDVVGNLRRQSATFAFGPPELRRRQSFWDTFSGTEDPSNNLADLETSFDKQMAHLRRSQNKRQFNRRPSFSVELSSAWLPEPDIEPEKEPTIHEEDEDEEEPEEEEEGKAAEGLPAKKRRRAKDEPPDGGWGWVIVFAVGLTFFISGGFGRAFTLTYQELLYRFGESSTATSLVAAIFGTVKMFSSPLVSALTNRFSHRTVAVVGGLISAAMMIVNAFPPSLVYLYVTYGVITAFATNMVTTPSLVIIGQYFRKKKGKAMGIAMLGVSLGGMAFPPLMTFLFREYGYPGTMIIVGGIMLHYCISGMLFRPLVPKLKYKVTSGIDIKRLDTNENMKNGHVKQSEDDEPRRPSLSRSNAAFNLSDETKKTPDDQTNTGDIDDGTVPPVEEKPRPKPIWFIGYGLLRLTKRNHNHNNNNSNSGGLSCDCCGGVLRYIRDLLGLPLLKDPAFVLFALLMVGTFVCLSVTTNFIAGLAEECGISQEQVALMISVSAFCDIPSRLSSGFLFDLKFVRESHRPTLFPIMGFLTGVFTFSLGLCNSYSSLFGFWIAYTFCSSAYHTQHITVLSDIVGPKQLTGALGLSRMFMGIGLIIGPTLGGYMKDSRGSYRVSYYVGGSSLIITSVLFEILNLAYFRKRLVDDEDDDDEDDIFDEKDIEIGQENYEADVDKNNSEGKGSVILDMNNLKPDHITNTVVSFSPETGEHVSSSDDEVFTPETDMMRRNVSVIFEDTESLESSESKASNSET